MGEAIDADSKRGSIVVFSRVLKHSNQARHNPEVRGNIPGQPTNRGQYDPFLEQLLALQEQQVNLIRGALSSSEFPDSTATPTPGL